LYCKRVSQKKAKARATPLWHSLCAFSLDDITLYFIATASGYHLLTPALTTREDAGDSSACIAVTRLVLSLATHPQVCQPDPQLFDETPAIDDAARVSQQRDT
jgi:hypothetical protein